MFNPSILPENLPALKEAVFHPLAPAHLRVSYYSTGILLAFLLIGAIILQLVIGSRVPVLSIVIWAGWLLIAGFLGWITPKSHHAQGYALRLHDFAHRSGVIFKRLTAIPYNRVQHVEITQGPLDRSFGLATLEIYTAGGSSSDLSIDGVTFEEAGKIKAFIIRRSAGEEEPGVLSQNPEADV